MSSSADSGLRDRLVAFYAVYNPSCVNSVDAIMATYKDREEDLLRVLVAKYGPEPRDRSESQRSRQSVQPPQQPSSQRSETPLELLAKDRAGGGGGGGAPPAPASSIRSVSPIPSAVGTKPATGRAVDESSDDLLVSILRRYASTNPPANEPLLPAVTVEAGHAATIETATGSSSAPTGQEHHFAPWSVRFHNFFHYYCPEKVPELARKLQLHEGHEAEWMKHLVSKYGPEPPQRRGVSHAHGASTTTVSVRSDGLRSPSPALHPQQQQQATAFGTIPLQPVLRHQIEGGAANEDRVGAVPLRVATDTRDRDVADVITRLSAALDTKTRELIGAKGARKELEAEVVRLGEQVAEFKESLAATQAERNRLRDELAVASQRAKDEAARHEADIQAAKSEMAGSGLQLRVECERLARALASREHQNRLIRAQAEQANAEVALREKHLGELSASLRQLHQLNRELVDDNAELRLALTEPTDERKFLKVVEDIQEASRASFEHRRRVLEVEMQQYYEYAKHQVAQRDATIAMLTEQIAAMSAAAAATPSSSTTAFANSASGGGGHTPSPTERALAEEVARLKLQLSVQSEELKVMLASIKTRSEFAPPTINAAAEAVLGDEVERLRRDLRRSQDEAAAAKEALQRELTREVEEMKDIHQRVEAYEKEKQHLLSTIEELKDGGHAQGPPGGTAVASRNDISVDGSYRPYTTTNMWTMLYNLQPR